MRCLRPMSCELLADFRCKKLNVFHTSPPGLIRPAAFLRDRLARVVMRADNSRYSISANSSTVHESRWPLASRRDL